MNDPGPASVGPALPADVPAAKATVVGQGHEPGCLACGSAIASSVPGYLDPGINPGAEGEPDWAEQVAAAQYGYRESEYLQKIFPAQALTAMCEQCLVNAANGDRLADDHATRERVTAQLRRLAALVGNVPTHAGWRTEVFRSEDLDPVDVPELVRLVGEIPTNPGIYTMYDSWVEALAGAGLLPGWTRRTTRGVVTLAADGHKCSSYGERLIDDWLAANGVPHTRDPHYPGSGMRGDFAVGDIIIEYWGLAGDAAYDAKSQIKREVAAAHRIDLLELFPADLATWDRSQEWVAQRLGMPPEPPGGRPQAPPIVDRVQVERPDRTTTCPIPSVSVPEPPHLHSGTAPSGELELLSAWRPDPFGAGAWRVHDGHAWTRRVQREDGIKIVHTPTVRREVSAQAANKVRTPKGLDQLHRTVHKMLEPDRGRDRPVPVRGKALELAYAWVDEHENHVAEQVRQYEAMLAAQDPDDPWAVKDSGWRATPKGQSYFYASWIFDRAQRRGAETAVHMLRARSTKHPFRDGEPVVDDASTNSWAKRLRDLIRHGHHPDDVDAGLAIMDPIPSADGRMLDLVT